MMAPTKMKLRVRRREGGAKRLLATEASPDSKCPICLDRFNNVASLDRCLHRFCFRCIHEWSKNKAECPLCKQPFGSIFHSVRAENDFKEFVLAPAENGPPATAPAPPAGQAEGGGGDPAGRALRARSARVRERRSLRRSNPAPPASSPPGVRLEGVPGAERERDVQHVMLRLTERRRSRAAERNLRRLRDRDVVAFRRALYCAGVRVRGSWDGGRARDVSAAYLRRSPACLRRLLPWLQRELTVLYGSHGSLVSIVQHVIMSRITHHDMDADAIRDELRPFLLARTDHFLHELVNFARSTLSMEAYDQQAVYECTAPSYEEDSASESSIIAISEDDDDTESEDTDVTEDPVQTLAPPVPMATGGESSLSQSAWDDETPGPSYSTLFPSPSQSQPEGEEPARALAQTDRPASASGGPAPCEEEEDEEEECMIVGYVKPMAERTPELVQLSSDSEEEEVEEEKGVVAPETPATTVTKTEASLSQVQAPPSSQPQACQSPSSCRSPTSPSCSPHTRTASPRHTPCYSSEERGGSRVHPRPRARSRSSGSSEELSECSRGGSRSRQRLGSASRHGEPSIQVPRGRGNPAGRRSPAVSILSDSSSVGWEPPRSKKARPGLRRPSRSSARWDSPGRDARERRRRGERDAERERSRSPPRAHAVPGSRHRDSRRRHGRRERRPRSSSRSSSGGRRSDPPRPEKPAGKHKYKTRHLERAARRQGRSERSRGGVRAASRSPSVEIIFERRPADTRSHVDQWRKRRKRSRKHAGRDQSSPAVITIDSESEPASDGTGLPRPTERLAPCPDPDPADPVTLSQACVSEVTEPRGLPSPTPPSEHGLGALDGLPETPSPRVSGESVLNLDYCAVDVMDRPLPESSPPGTAGDLRQDDTVATETPPSDTRLLESILQELEDILPDTRPALDGAGDQQEGGIVPHRDQSEAGTESVCTDYTKAGCVPESDGQTSPAV